MGLPLGLLTVDLEDYRRQELRDHCRPDEPPHPREVEAQLHRMFGLFDACDVHATFFSVGRLARELSPGVWREVAGNGGHRVGCHGHEHLRVDRLGPARFRRDLRDARAALEDVTGRPVVSYRAPYFSADGCDPWFGEGLARAGFTLDSSRRLRSVPPGFSGTLPLPGGGGVVREVPLPAFGIGGKRVTVIGGTYLRLFPLSWVLRLLRRGRESGFVPMIYLHPYDLDPSAAPLDHPWPRFWKPWLGDRLRRVGRQSAAEKVRALARLYDLRPLESLLIPGEGVPASGDGDAPHPLALPPLLATRERPNA